MMLLIFAAAIMVGCGGSDGTGYKGVSSIIVGDGTSVVGTSTYQKEGTQAGVAAGLFGMPAFYGSAAKTTAATVAGVGATFTITSGIECWNDPADTSKGTTYTWSNTYFVQYKAAIDMIPEKYFVRNDVWDATTKGTKTGTALVALDEKSYISFFYAKYPVIQEVIAAVSADPTVDKEDNAAICKAFNARLATKKLNLALETSLTIPESLFSEQSVCAPAR